MSAPIIPPIPGPILPNFPAYTQITPFTVRDGATYLLTLEALRDWIECTFTPEVNAQIQLLETSWETNANDLANQFETISGQLIQQVNDAIQQVIDSSVTVQDPVVAGILANATSDTRVAADALYAAKSIVDALTALTDTGRLSADALAQQIGDAIVTEIPWTVADDTSALQAAINAALAAGEQTVQLTRNKVYNVNVPIELSNTSSTAQNRQSVTLVGPATIKPLNTFTGSAVIKHSQSAAQATANSLAVGAGLRDITIDGSNLIASSVNGIRFDGAWMPVLSRVTVLNMTGHGVAFLADNTINSVDDTYATVGTLIDSLRVSGCAGWGIYQTRFAAPFTARAVYITNNVMGGIRLTAPHTNIEGGAVAYNGGPGIFITKSDSASGSTLSEVIIRSVELDTNAVNNVWVDNALNITFESVRLITREAAGVYVTPSLVRLGGTSGNSVNGVRFNKPYVRANQQTVNPPITFYQIDSQAAYTRIVDHYELAGTSTAKTVATRDGQNTTIQSITGEYIFSDTDKNDSAFFQASQVAALTISTAQTDIVWDTVGTDLTGRYNPATGEYQFKDDNGVFRVRGFLTVPASAATSARRIMFALRFNPNSGYSTIKQMSVPVQIAAIDQVVPFDFMVRVTTPNALVKIAAFATTGTAILVGTSNTDFTVNKVN